jgi:EpsI family protein
VLARFAMPLLRARVSRLPDRGGSAVSATGRLAVVLVALSLLTALLWTWMWAMGVTSPAGPLEPLSEQLGPWQLVAEEELSGKAWESIRPDAYQFRRYEATDRRPIWAYVGAYTGRSDYGSSAHDPNDCYPAAGFEIIGSRAHRLSLPGGDALEARLIEVQRDRQRETVLYWFQPADRWPLTPISEQFTQVLDALQGRPQYAFVRLSAPSDGTRAAERHLEEFAREIAWPVRMAVTRFGGSSAAPDISAIRDHQRPVL